MSYTPNAQKLVDKVKQIPEGAPQGVVSQITLALALPYIIMELEKISHSLQETNSLQHTLSRIAEALEAIYSNTVKP